MILSSISGPAVDPLIDLIGRVGDPEKGFDLRQLIPLWLDRPMEDALDNGYLEAMAWQFDMDIRGLSQVEKVAIIREAISLYRSAGTSSAIKRMLLLMRYESVSIVEGSVRDLVHDGFWNHDGDYTHGTDFIDWAVFSIAITGRRGIIGDRVLAAINKLRPERTKMKSLSAQILCEITTSKPLFAVNLIATDGAHPVSYTIEPGTIIIDVGEPFSEKHITGVRVLDDVGGEAGIVNFSGEIWRGSCPVSIRIAVIYIEADGPIFDSPVSTFDDTLTTF